jgi:hypothetical protein
MAKSAYKRLRQKRVYGALLSKDIRCVLKRELITNFGFENMGAIADLLIERLLTIYKEHSKPKDELMPYQTIVLAVDKNQRRGKWKTMSMTKMKPIIINLMTTEERQRLVNGERIKQLRPDMVIRMMNEADSQGAALSYNDITMLTGLSVDGVSEVKQRYLKDHPHEFIPHAGTVFDMGRSVSHKKQIIEEHLKCLLTKEIAEKMGHHPVNVDSYINNFNRIFELYEDGKNERQIFFITRLSISLVKEYMELIHEFNVKNKIKTTKN